MKINSHSSWLDLATLSGKENVESLKLIEADLLTEYQNYDNLIINHQNELNESEFIDNKDLMKDFYENAPKRLKIKIVDRRNNHGLLECPFCGNPQIPDTLDHFIPKDDWPEYAIYPNNLVPQCRGCAPIKGKKYYSSDLERAIFIHPIYSDILSKFSFKIEVNFDIQTKSYDFSLKIKKPVTIDIESLNRVVEHLKTLKLTQRVNEYCHKEILKWEKKLKEKKFDIRFALNTRIKERNVNEISKNWKTALYLGMLENNELIIYLNSLSPQDTDTDTDIEVDELVFELD